MDEAVNVSIVGISVSLVWMGVSQGTELLHTESVSCIYTAGLSVRAMAHKSVTCTGVLSLPG